MNPTNSVDLDFTRYLVRRRDERSSLSVAGMPDYGFALDAALRQRLAAIGPVRAVAQAITSGGVPLYTQLHTMESIAIGPNQLPDIHAIGLRCAERLGIGVPQLFLSPERTPNAFTIATDDVAPIVILTAGLVDALTPDELTFVIGHECGHIHNLHGVYNTTVELMANPVAQTVVRGVARTGASIDVVRLVLAALQGGLKLFMLQWSRCAEITCDRAGLICCGDCAAAERALVKLAVGGSGAAARINIDAYLQQLETLKGMPLRLAELGHTHPLTPRRIEAVRLFHQCEVYHRWRPGQAEPALHSREETDRRCEAIVAVVQGKGAT